MAQNGENPSPEVLEDYEEIDSTTIAYYLGSKVASADCEVVPTHPLELEEVPSSIN